MGWWDNLWLNEGFASWMQVKAAEHFYPQWQSWLTANDQKQYAMSLDARRTSHPIQQPVANESEAMAVFDGITYSKGQALIRMLENYLGEQAFRAGIRKYMADHAYGSTTTADLWRALETASGKPVARGCRGLHRAGRGPAGDRAGDLRRRDAAHHAAAGALHPPRSRRGAAAVAGAGRDRAAARAAAGRNRRGAGRVGRGGGRALAASRSKSITATSAISACNTMRRRMRR